MSSSGCDQTSSCAIIAGYLKFKVLRIKGGKDVGSSSSPSTQGPKAWKQYWFEFRVPNSTVKVVEYYDKGQEKPKGVILLDLVVSVQLLVPHKKQQFMMECSDGQARIFETLTIEETYSWVTALNAVLFGKNMRGEIRLEYSVALQPSTFLDYYGPCILVINETDIVVHGKDLSEDQVIVRWKLHHLRSFRAKKDSFVVRTGSRTTTGSGEFFFSTKEDESVLMTYAVEAVLARLKTKMAISNTSINMEPHQDSASRRSMLPPPPPPTDDLGILSPPMDTTQAPGHLDPGVEGHKSLSVGGPRGPAYMNVDQGGVDLRPQGRNQQEFAWTPESNPSPLQRPGSTLHNSRAVSARLLDGPNKSSLVESAAFLSRSVTHSRGALSRRSMYDEVDQVSESPAGVTPEHHSSAPSPPTSSLYSVLGEEEVEQRDAPPPYDKLNRGMTHAGVLLASMDGYSRIQWEEDDGLDTCAVHKNFSSNPDFIASQAQDQTTKAALYDTVYESTRSNSSGSITSSSRNHSPLTLVAPQMQGQATRKEALYDTVYESTTQANSSGPITSHRYHFPPSLVVSQDQTTKAALYDSVYESTRSNSVGSITSSSRDSFSECDAADGKETRNEPHTVFGHLGSHQLKAVAHCSAEGNKKHSGVVESPSRPAYRSPVVNGDAVDCAQGGTDTTTVDQVIEDRPSVCPTQDRNKIPKPPPLAPTTEDEDIVYMTVSDDDPPASPDTAHKKPLASKSFPSDKPRVVKPLVTVLKEGSRDKATTFSNKQKIPEALDGMYVLLTDEPETQSNANQKCVVVSQTKKSAVSPVVDRRVIAKTEGNAATPLQREGSKATPPQREGSKATPPQREGSKESSFSEKLDTELLAEVGNVTYGMLTDDQDYNQDSTKLSPGDRQMLVKSERSLNGPQKDCGGRDKAALPKGRPEEVARGTVDAMYALLTDEDGSQDNMTAKCKRPPVLAQQDTIPKMKVKPLPRPPVARKPAIIPKPHPPPKPSVPAQGQSSRSQPTTPQKTGSPKPPVSKRVMTSKAPLNQYEGDSPVPKPRPKVVPS